MNYALWSDIFRVIAIIGSVITILAAVGQFVSGKAADRVKAGQIRQLEAKVTAFTEYSEVARLDLRGKPFADGDIVFNSPLSRMMEPTYHTEGNSRSFNRSPEAESQLRNVIAAYPKFPFAYYGLALCMRDRGDPAWKAKMIQAQEIFRITTTLPGHNDEQDDALRRIDRLLENEA